MKASDMPSAATREAGSTSTAKVPSGRMKRQPDQAGGEHGQAGHDHAPSARSGRSPRGARAIMPIMMSTVIGSSAAPLGNAL